MRQAIPPKPRRARQLLPSKCYTSPEWFEREHRELFSRAWTFACVAQDVPEPGDYRAVQANRHAMFVVRQRDGGLAAFHNTCRHRGTQIYEDGASGNCRHGVVCPYHSWTYDPWSGGLRGLPKKELAFPQMKLENWPLHRGSVGQLGDLIFVNPQKRPEDDFESWLGAMRSSHMWPHRLDGLSEKRPVRYDILGNWKTFCENAMDGYHLSYLHDKTLKGPDIEEQDWNAVGRHWVFIAHEANEERRKSHYAPIPGARRSGRHPVVWQFFPNSGVLASEIFFSAYVIAPVGPERCHLELRTWMMPREAQDPAAPRTQPSGTSGHGHIMKDGKRYSSTAELGCHAMESLDFQIEDMWVVEQQQKGFHHPRMRTGQLADRGETSLTWFQANVLDYVPLVRRSPQAAAG